MSESGEMNELNEMCRAGFQFVVESVAKQELAEQKARSRSKNRNQM
jgi:diphthamide synthase (EF-2-diphthine--ammonia ligase)